MEVIITKNKLDDVGVIFDSLFKDKSFCFFDIETTGLSRQYSKVILIGLLYIEDGQKVVKQYFCDNPSEEKDMLELFYSDIKKYDLLVTYNGHSFDIPFLNARFNEHNMDYSLDPHIGFDIYRLVRKNRDKLGLNKTNLKSVEEYLGIKRYDTISGKESIDLYYDYCNNHNLASKDKVILHNLDDLRFLFPLVKILDDLDIHTIYNEYPCTISTKDYGTLKVGGYKKKKDFLIIDGYSNIKDYYNHSSDIDINISDNIFSLKFPLINIKLSDDMKVSFFDTQLLNIDLGSISPAERNQYLVSINKDLQHMNIVNILKNIFI